MWGAVPAGVRAMPSWTLCCEKVCGQTIEMCMRRVTERTWNILRSSPSVISWCSTHTIYLFAKSLRYFSRRIFLGRPGMPLVYPYYCVSRKAGDKLIEIDR